ncbi:MAG: DUF4398 domain-containing protein [Deltaproteobacteria bacterium]|nr:DUF4398 domain-containing protein [Deltaproteobacteria bacterium]
MKFLGQLAVVAALAGAAACSPIVGGVGIVNANIALSAAETAGAKRSAVYEYTAAREYLQKAREEYAYSDFWASRIYAEKAESYAVAARKKAEAVSSTDQPVILPESSPPAVNAPPVIVPTP